MFIKPFLVEQWMNAYEVGAKYNIAETCVDSVSLDELFELIGEDKDAFFKDFSSRRLTYGDIEGKPEFREGISRLYKSIEADNIVTTHGASGANHHVFLSTINPGDEVISIMPTYQQLYSIPQALGAKLQMLELKNENGFLPDLDELRNLVTPNTKMICINNPNNPTGALILNEHLEEIVEIAKSVDAYIFCDEVYRHLTQEDYWSESIVDLYDKGISVGSMSKVFSLAGLRQGWIATRNKELIEQLYLHRDYNLISCGMFDESISAIALKHSEKILDRNRNIVRENLKILDDWVKSEPKVFYTKPQAGTTALVYYDFDISSYDFCIDMYNQTGAFVTPGDCFEQPKSMRIGYANDKEVLIQGLDAISKYIRNL